MFIGYITNYLKQAYSIIFRVKITNIFTYLVQVDKRAKEFLQI